MKSDDEDLDTMENLDHDPSKYTNLMKNMEGIECEYNKMGLEILGTERKIKNGNIL
jgi:hypothetical protein